MRAPSPLRSPLFRAALASGTLERLGSSALTALLGFQLFALTGRPMDLGWLGMVEAIPGVGLVLYGGHMADRHRRRFILVLTAGLLAAIVFGLAASSSLWPGRVAPLFVVAFLQGVVRAFNEPAAAGMEAQVVPLESLVGGLAMLATTSRLAGVLGPLVGGLAWAWLGAAGTYAGIGGLFALSMLALLRIPDSAQPPTVADPQGALVRIAQGVRVVVRDQVLLGSMALDLFAVFFGGAAALLPAVASGMLQVGPVGFGVLRGAPGAGALVAAVLAPRLLPQRRAGVALLGVIGGFGVAMVVLGLSRTLWLSVAALAFAGLCDGMSVVIRRAILRLGSPEAMRGRVAAVKSVFVGSSNELGAFESGVAATLLGVPAAIWTGGLATLAIVGATAFLAPRLRRLDLREYDVSRAG